MAILPYIFLFLLMVVTARLEHNKPAINLILIVIYALILGCVYVFIPQYPWKTYLLTIELILLSVIALWYVGKRFDQLDKADGNRA